MGLYLLWLVLSGLRARKPRAEVWRPVGLAALVAVLTVAALSPWLVNLWQNFGARFVGTSSPVAEGYYSLQNMGLLGLLTHPSLVLMLVLSLFWILDLFWISYGSRANPNVGPGGRNRERADADQRPPVFDDIPSRAEVAERIRMPPFYNGIGFRRERAHCGRPSERERMRQVPATGTRIQSGRCASSYSIS